MSFSIGLKFKNKKIIMRKILPLLVLALLITAGCSSTETTQAPASSSNSGETTQAADKAPVQPSSDAQATSTTDTINKDTMTIDQTKFEDLAKEYTHVVLKTSLGDIEVELYGADSPKTVNNFLNLAKLGFYDGTKFHRVIKDFMIQGGDPNSKSSDWSTHGRGGPGYQFADEFNQHKLVRGSLAMANAGPDTNGSQFFIVTAQATPWLDGKHTNFGQVVKSLDVVDKIEGVETNQNDHPLNDVVVEKIELKK
jgi:peptidyl-prolyl cis-trans isomerase B (cyclophilin B)